MYEPLRILMILIYKSWLTRKKCLITLLIIEALLPVALAAMLTWVSQLMNDKPPKEVKEDMYFDMKSMNGLLREAIHDHTRIYYAPNNSFANELMKNVDECVKNSAIIKGFASENEFVAYYYGANIGKNSWSIIGVMFDESIDKSVKHLRYKLRYKETLLPLYNSKSRPVPMYHHYVNATFLAQTQICLDRSFVTLKSGNQPIPGMHIQQVPHPAHAQQSYFDETFLTLIHVSLVMSMMVPVSVESWFITCEVFTGATMLMSLNGISNAMNLLSWLIGGLLFLAVFCDIPMILLFTRSFNYGLPYLHYGNPLLLYFVFTLYHAHLLAYGIHIPAYYKGYLTVPFSLMNFVLSFAKEYLFDDSTLYFAPYLGIIFPNILFLQALEEFRTYENLAEGIQWRNLFVNANPNMKMGGSVGMIILFFLLGTCFHLMLGIYVYAVSPGKFKPGKHPLFFLKSVRMRSSASELEESIESEERNSEYFEPVPEGVYVPGIQIRNLKKTYESGILHKQKVEALRGVTIDFYKGQITSLLGHNGAGKTTMISILTGATDPTSGMVLIDSKNLAENVFGMMKDIGVCTQEDYNFQLLSVKEQLEMFAMVKRKDESISSIRGEVKALLRGFNLIDKENVRPQKLSGGQQRLLSLCVALVGNSDTLILDEPTTGLDPANRRIVWDILLKMRGEKTILISTHDMEEADILGDRIAIMHTGQMKSYGTSSFLKKLIGHNNIEVVCSIDSRSDPERIRKELHANGVIKSRETKRIIVSIPNSPQLPDSLDNLERKKKELGISGFSVTLISLEQVFLKITEENDGPPEASQPVAFVETQPEGNNLFLRTLRALFFKKLLYAMKDFSRFRKPYSVIVATISQAVIFLILQYVSNVEGKSRAISARMYQTPDVLYASYKKDFGDRYQSIVRNSNGNPIDVSGNDISLALMQRAKNNLVVYDLRMIAAADYTEGYINALYSETAIYSLPISINLLHDALIKHLVGPDHSISLFSQDLPHELPSNLDFGIQFGSESALLMALDMITILAVFVVQPSRELMTNFKQMQKMTGVSGISYWATTFVSDLMEYVLTVLLLITCLFCMDWILGLRLFGPTEILIEIFLLLLFGINALPIVYSCTFLKKNAVTVMPIVVLGPMMIMLFFGSPSVELEQESTNKKQFHLNQDGLFPVLPYVSFYHTQISFFITAHINAKCRRLPNEFYDLQCKQYHVEDVCCGFDCYNGRCDRPMSFFSEGKGAISLKPSIEYLCWTPILYFIILALLEGNYIQQIFSSHQYYEEAIDVIDPNAQVHQEKIKISEQLYAIDQSNLNYVSDGRAELPGDSSNIYYFLAYELQKRYDQVKAVKDVSFGVDRQECFGLLGVNGAGKTTTFRVITGGERPDNGIMYIGVKNSKADRKSFLAEIGYCPQNDALLKCLNSYDHLRLFASLRGIPEDKIESEVQAWIDRLNLNACAERSSGTYSGGNKRRLSVANALIGNPSLIILDEPTTGIDPGIKRSLWNFIKARQAAGQTVILSSHSTEECEVLCNRLAIMVDGRLVCIGVSEELKQRYGVGYDIKIRMNLAKSETQLDDIKKDMSRMLSCTLSDEYLANLVYHVVPDVNTTWRKMYDVMNGLKMKFDCIEEFSILSSSLEQLFMIFVRGEQDVSSVG